MLKLRQTYSVAGKQSASTFGKCVLSVMHVTSIAQAWSCTRRDEREAALRMLQESQEQFSREKNALLTQCNAILEKASSALHEQRSPRESRTDVTGAISQVYPEMLSPNQLADLKRRQISADASTQGPFRDAGRFYV